MLLRNYDNLMVARNRPSIIEKYVSTGTATFGDGVLNVRRPNGTQTSIYNYGSYTNMPFSSFIDGDITQGDMNYAYSKLIAGEGDTTVTYDDYSLSKPFTTSQVAYINNSQKVSEPIYDEVNKTWTFEYSRIVTALEDITVREIGVLYSVQHSKSYFYSVLVYRKVLDTPIEVPAGANLILSFTTTVSANPNKPADYDATAVVAE